MEKRLEVMFSIAVLMVIGLCAQSVAAASGCVTCGDVKPGSSLEVRIEYKDGTMRSACGLRCAGAILAAYREKDVKTLWVREYKSGELLDAKKAFWVLNPDKKSQEAFAAMSDAEAFSVAHYGKVVDYKNMMAALFSGMYDEIGKAELVSGPDIKDDITSYPECAYCGMDRKKYAHSRVLLKYRDGSEVGLCSLHCAGLDLALHPEKVPARIMVGTYDRKKLLDAQKAVWVLGGSEHGVMSIRGKWAFENREDAEVFLRDLGGSIASFRDIMTAVFEDMWEIIR